MTDILISIRRSPGASRDRGGAGRPGWAKLAPAGGGFRLLEGPRNPVAGIVDGLSFTGGEVQLAPGSALVLYTDGVTEARDHEAREFGAERLAATLDAASGRDAAGLIGATIAAVDAFAAGAVQADDITMLALRYRGPAAAG